MSKRELAIELGIMAAGAIVLALLGPFGMFAQPLAGRLLEWLAFALGGYAFFRPVIAAGDALVAQVGLPRWIALAFACALASLPTTALVAWVLAGMNWPRLTAGYLAGLYLNVLLLGGVATVLQIFLHPKAIEEAPVARPEPRIGEGAVASPPVAPSSPLLDRLPPAIGVDLLCLENEDHYVRVHTRSGSALILMRMRDAVAELEPMDGVRVHRSWWVARNAVAEVVRRNRAILLRLSDGREVPVARAMVPDLRERGWL